jgi:hypothetical protein
MIPIRNRKDGKTYGLCSEKMLRYFKDPIYHRRSLIKTISGVMKRPMGSCIQSMSLAPQCNKVILMCAVHNIHRRMAISFHGLFLHGLLLKTLK